MARLAPSHSPSVPTARMGRRASDARERCVLVCPAPDAVQRLLAQALEGTSLAARPARSAEQIRDILFDEVVALAIVHFGRDIPQGVATCRSIHKHPSGEDVPILAVVEAAALPEYPLDGGADDVLVSPFTPEEVALRVRLCLWRHDEPLQQAAMKIGDVSIDFGAMRVRFRGVPVDLTYKEFELLRYFVQNPGAALRREQILEAVWGDDYFGGDRTVDIHVRRLRAKIPPLSEHIETVHGVGYRFGVPPVSS
jgi:DNA-binding response OmpR family regulator